MSLAETCRRTGVFDMSNNSEPSEQARKCWSDIEESQGKEFTYVHSTELEIIQRHMDAYHLEQSKELVKDKERLEQLVTEQSCTITKLCEAIDPTHTHGPETDKICAYAIKFREFSENSVLLKRIEALENLSQLQQMPEMYDGPAPGESISKYTEAMREAKALSRWATEKEQQRNRRDNRIVSINGVSKCLCEWCEQFQIKSNTVAQRLVYGWDIVEAITRPITQYKPKS